MAEPEVAVVAVRIVGLTVARAHLPLGPRWGFTVVPHPGQPHATVMPGVEQSVRSVMPGVEPRGRRPRERPVDVPGWAPGARAEGPAGCRVRSRVRPPLALRATRRPSITADQASR